MVMRSGPEKRVATAAGTASEIQVLTFNLSGQEYAFNIVNVVQVVRMVAITPAPRASKAVEGMINVRSRVIPVVNLRKQFALPGAGYSHNDHLLIAQAGQRMAAVIVDTVREVLIIPSDSLEPPSEIAAELGDYLSAVAKLGDRMLLILDLDKLLDGQDDARQMDGLLAQFNALRQRLERAVAPDPLGR